MSESKLPNMPSVLKNYYKSIGLVLHCVALLFATATLTAADARVQQGTEFLDDAYPYKGDDMDARQTLDDFSRLTGLPVEADVSGLVSVNNEDGTVRDFLNGFAKKTRCIWWYDGFTIRLEPRSNMRSVVIGTRGIDISTLSSTMDFIGLKENQFTTRMSPDGTLFNVVGPEGYVGAVESLIDQIITARKSRREGLPAVYRGQFASNRNSAPATQPVTAQITSAPAER